MYDDPSPHQFKGKWKLNHVNNSHFRLTHQSKILIAVYGCFTTASACSNTFLGIYLWKSSRDLALIGWFTLALHIAMAFTFWVGGKWIKEYNKMISLRVGIMFSAVFYVLILWLSHGSIQYIFILGLIQGIASGMFWLAFNVIYFEVTNRNDRDRFNSYTGLLTSIAGMFAPWVSGIIVTRFVNDNGYRIIFLISLVIYVIGVLISLLLNKRQLHGHYEWFFAWECLRKRHTPWRQVSLALVAQGARDAVFGFFISLLVYTYTSSEATLGNYMLFTSLVSFISYWWIGKWITPRVRRRAMFIGVLMLVVVMLPLLWEVNGFTLFVFGMGTSICMPLYALPMLTTVFDLIGSNQQSAEKREEFVVLRELCLNVGRMLSTSAFIIVASVAQSLEEMMVFLVIVGCLPWLSWFLISKKFPFAGVG